MTCIVAVEHGGRVLLGSDSFLGGAFTRDVIDRPKFFKVHDRFAVGFAGGLRPAQVLEHEVKFPKQRKNQSDEKYLVNVASAIRKAFESEGALQKDVETAQQVHDSLFCFALNGKVYVMQEDFSVIRSNAGLTAIGAGADFALGALVAMRHLATSPEEVEEKVRRALEASVELSPQVCQPLHFMWV